MTAQTNRARPLFVGKDAAYKSAMLHDAKQAMLKGKQPADFDLIKETFDDLVGRFGPDNAVPVAALMTDDYQRHSEPDEQRSAVAAVARIAKNFNPKALGISTVGRRDNGDVFALDGVHRAILGFLSGAEFIPAIVEDVADEREEAILYSILNVGRKAVSSHSKSRSMSLIDEESLDRKLSDLLSTLDRRVIQTDIGGPAMAKRMIKWQGPEAFADGIAMHELCWPDAPVKPEIAGAFGWMTSTFGLTVDDFETEGSPTADMIEHVQEAAGKPNHLLNAVPVDSTGHKHGEARVQAIVEQLLVKWVNSTRKGKARLNPRKLPWSEESIQRTARERQEAAEEAMKAKAVADALAKVEAKLHPEAAAEDEQAGRQLVLWEPSTTIEAERAADIAMIERQEAESGRKLTPDRQ